MKVIDRFLLHDFSKSLKKCDVAFVIDDIQSYNKALASVRMRCYDMILWLEKQGIKVELYKPYKKYKIAFYIKTRSERAIRIAEKMQKQGTIMIMDPYCEVIDQENVPDNWERKNILHLLQYMFQINVNSNVQFEKFRKYHKNIKLIGDNVNDAYFNIQKETRKDGNCTLVYCGYHKKAKDLLCIKDVLINLRKKYNCDILLISDKDPQLKEISYKFVKYNQKKIPELFCLGDIMIAPRPMEGIENLSHSNTKIAYPMSVGLPVVASPVPSYLDSPAILCKSEDEWYAEVEKLILNSEYRECIGKQSKEFIKNNYALSHLGKDYLEKIKQCIK